MKSASAFPLDDKKVVLRVANNDISLPAHLRAKIDEYWQRRVQDNPHLHNGEVYTIVGQNEAPNAWEFELAKTDYAHFVYSREIGGLAEKAVHVIHPACLVIAGGQLIFGQMAAHTSLAGTIQCCGGGLDDDALKTDGTMDINMTMTSELREELGLNVRDSSLVKSFKPELLLFVDSQKVVLAYSLELKITAEQFLERYDKFAGRLFDEGSKPEFDRLLTVKANAADVEAFIKKHWAKLNQYMPMLLRAA